jgi:hypothetical protein
MKCGDMTPDILLHSLAGFRAQKSPKDPALQRFAEFVSEGIAKYETVLRPRALQPRPLNGSDLVNFFGLKPSAAFKPILDRIEEEHLVRQTLTRGQAFELVQKLLNKAKAENDAPFRPDLI